MSTTTASTFSPDLGTLASVELGPVLESIAGRAAALDRGEADLREDIRALAELGLFDVDRTPVAVAAAVLELVAAESLAVAFGAWAQRMTAAYLRHAADRSAAALATYRAVADGIRPGVTGMAAAQRQAVGLGQVPVPRQPSRAGIGLTARLRGHPMSTQIACLSLQQTQMTVAVWW